MSPAPISPTPVTGYLGTLPENLSGKTLCAYYSLASGASATTIEPIARVFKIVVTNVTTSNGTLTLNLGTDNNENHKIVVIIVGISQTQIDFPEQGVWSTAQPSLTATGTDCQITIFYDDGAS